MKEFFTSKKFIIILGICAVFIGVMIYSAVSSTTFLSSGLGALFAPVQSVTNSVSSWISSRFDMTQATVSYHLSQLKKAELITENKQKNFIYYELNTSVVEEVMLWLADLKGGNDNEP